MREADPRFETGSRKAENLLILCAMAMPIAFSAWMALLNNFAHDVVNFDGEDIGVAQAVREIPGFLSFLVVYMIVFMREQRIAILSLFVLGFGSALTGLLPTYWGIMFTTLLSSIGFHYYEVVNQSLQLQWIPRDRAPQVMGRLLGYGSVAGFFTFGAVWVFSLPSVIGNEPPYVALYLLSGSVTMAMAVFAWFYWPIFNEFEPQLRKIILRKRYWLYYAIVCIAGARRQIFVVFAAFMMVQKFGFTLREFVLLLIINHAVNVYFAPFMGKMTKQFGERAVLTFEYLGLIVVFGAYMVVENPMIAAALYIVDHLFFGLSFAQKTYFQKIADPRHIAPTAAVAFTINHIAAVALPWPLGILYVVSGPYMIFGIGVALAFCSLILVQFIPRHPTPDLEIVAPWRRVT